MSPCSLEGYRPLQIPYRLDFESWSRKEAKAFFEWFVGQVDDRMAELQRVIRAWNPRCRLDRSPDSLVCVGRFLMDHAGTRLQTPEELKGRRAAVASNPRVPAEAIPVVEAMAGDWALDDTTLYLCVDVGIYFAEVLRAAHPSLRWDFWTHRTVEFHRPVLRGFNGPLNPSGIAETVALGFVQGERNPGRLKELFDYWSKNVATGPSVRK